jgi:hypothetical protein
VRTLDKAKAIAFNARVEKNQHRWRKSLDERSLAILDEFSGKLRDAWDGDSGNPKTYPWWSDEAFGVVRSKLKGNKSGNRSGKLPLGIRRSPPARRFADLFDEKLIRAVYKDRHSESYNRTLTLADSRERGAPKAFHQLLRAVETAYWIGFGFEFVPVPKVHFLHRGLFEVVKLCGLDALTNEGLEEFFEDLCPCGKKHNAEALRKLRKRVAKSA